MKSRQVVMITGASAGLGRAIAHAFAKKGARIGLMARNVDALNAGREEVIALGGEALVLPCDVSDAAAVEQAAGKLEEAFGPLDVWINNAMVSVFSPATEMLPEEYKRVTEVTYLGYVHGTLAALRRMVARDRGTIVQIGSALAVRSIPLQSAYCASKQAIVGFTDSLRCELHHDKSNVQITMVQMPAMNTLQFTWVKSRLRGKPHPMGPIFQPEIAAAVVVHAARQERPRREYWVGSPTLKAIVGHMLAPGMLDRYLGETGYEAQQTDELDNPDRPDNLWHPVAGTHGARGPFDKGSATFSPQVFANLHRGWFLCAGAVLVTLMAVSCGARSSKTKRKGRTSNGNENRTGSQ